MIKAAPYHSHRPLVAGREALQLTLRMVFLVSSPQQQRRERELRKQQEREQRRRYEEMEQLRREEERRHAEREQVHTHGTCVGRYDCETSMQYC